VDIGIQKSEKISGELDVPPSKLYTQFATALALLAEGKSTLKQPLRTKDTLAILRAVENMGATVKRTQDQLSIWGVGQSLRPTGNVIDVKNSATGMAMMTAIAALSPRVSVITGDAQLRARPMPQLLKVLNNMGLNAYSTKPDDSPPLVVLGGDVRGGRISVKGVNPSLIPALLIPCPYAKKKIEFLSCDDSLQLNLALDVMKAANVKVSCGKKLSIPNQPYRPFNLKVPSDLAAVAPFVVAAVLTDSKLKFNGTDLASDRGAVLLDILKKMDVKVEMSNKFVLVRGPQQPRGTKLDLSLTPELLPIVAVLAAMARGRTTISGASEARAMKSDRISAIAHGLRKMGVKLSERKDGLIVEGQAKIKGGEVDGCNDHAVVAALVTAGMLAEVKTVVKNKAEALQTSYSRFISTFQELGARVGYAE
jgi:3-phosphoshikimate 1-carboxyvinyltransferase